MGQTPDEASGHSPDTPSKANELHPPIPKDFGLNHSSSNKKNKKDSDDQIKEKEAPRKSKTQDVGQFQMQNSIDQANDKKLFK